VPLPARLTDAVIDGDVDLRVELQSEDVGRGEWVALLAPQMTPLPAALDGALRGRHSGQHYSALSAARERGTGWVGEEVT
jgi:hypothetical protein